MKNSVFIPGLYKKILSIGTSAILIFFIISCTMEVTVDDVIITNELCDELIEQLGVGAEEDQDYVPKDYGCNGYIKINDICIESCAVHEDCDPEHYCNFSTATCDLKGVGKCTSDEYCRVGVCLCDMCLNFMELL